MQGFVFVVGGGGRGPLKMASFLEEKEMNLKGINIT